MSLLKKIVFASAALMASAGIAQANLLPVSISWTGTDSVGQAVEAKLVQEITESNNMRLVNPGSNAPHLAVFIVSEDVTRTYPGTESAMSYALVAEPSGEFFTSGVQTCGKLRVDYCASGIVAAILVPQN